MLWRIFCDSTRAQANISAMLNNTIYDSCAPSHMFCVLCANTDRRRFQRLDVKWISVEYMMNVVAMKPAAETRARAPHQIQCGFTTQEYMEFTWAWAASCVIILARVCLVYWQWLRHCRSNSTTIIEHNSIFN